MEDWISRICDEVDHITAQQPYYRELLSRREELEQRYLEILGSLSDADAEIVAEYHYLTTEMSYQRTQTAYRLGCRKQAIGAEFSSLSL